MIEKHRVHPALKDFRADWFKEWHQDLDVALGQLPEMSGCSHELYKMLIQHSSGAKKRIVLVTRKNEPIGLLGLRRRHRDWVPVTHYLLPGAVFPVNAEYWTEVLEILRIDLWISWWRMGSQPPVSPLIRNVERVPTYKVNLTEDYEKYWTKKFRQQVRHFRNLCSDISYDVNAPGSADWTIRNWNKKWHDVSESEENVLRDRLLVADYLERIGRHFTLILRDKDKPVSGVTVISHGEELVGEYSYRVQEYDSIEVGKFILDVLFKWALENGFAKVDLGGDYEEHKKRWAPQDGEKLTFNVCPEYLYRIKNFTRNINRIRSRGISYSDARRLLFHHTKNHGNNGIVNHAQHG
jgi:hypothetical protein